MPDRSEGIAAAERLGPRGMIAIRAELSDGAARGRIAEAAGAEVPEPLTWSGGEGGGLAWMSPDELLWIGPADGAADAAGRFRDALSGVHALVLDVSSMRAAFRVSGAAARVALAKLAPADLSPRAFGPRAFRRTRLAQAPAALRAVEGGIEVYGFRSQAVYIADILHGAVVRGPAPDLIA